MKKTIAFVLLIGFFSMLVISCTEEVIKPKDTSDLTKDPKSQF